MAPSVLTGGWLVTISDLPVQPDITGHVEKPLQCKPGYSSVMLCHDVVAAAGVRGRADPVEGAGRGRGGVVGAGAPHATSPHLPPTITTL